MIYNKIKMNKKSAFSLVEVLISLVLISLVMVAMAPVITKRIVDRTNDGVVFTYNKENNTAENDVCYTTNILNYDSLTESYTSTNRCSEYQFRVPDGVHKVNLTLVAGGGGGGGAAGGFIQNYELETKDTDKVHTNLNGFIPDIVKEVVIKAIVTKGQSGSDINSNCNASDNKCGGKGGNSSAAIVNFKLPNEYKSGFNFTNNLQTSSTIHGQITLRATNTNSFVSVGSNTNSTISDTKKALFGVELSDNTYKTYCSLGGSRIDTLSGALSKCGFNLSSLIGSASGAFGRGEANNTTVYTGTDGTIFSGGAGAAINGAYGYGAGGDGAYLKLTCPGTGSAKEQCTIQNAISNTAISATDGKGPYSAVEYKTERPGGTGGGGAAGAAVRILNLPVTPNETYIVRVGAGGAGGNSGVASTSPSGGVSGVGGTSSAIYDSNGNLIYMVNGGAGGEGGKIWNASSGLYTGEIGISGRYNPKVISGDNSLITNITIDESIASTTNTGSATRPARAGNSGSLTSVNVTYNFNEIEPYNTLNTKRTEFSDYSDTKSGGFSGFDKTATNSYNASINGSTINGVYDGFYYRNLMNNTASYIGGLGGFSPVSQKAGCGGYFMGNFDGRTSFSSNDNNVINKFLVDNNVYPVSKYYENCSTTSPNGTKAEFIAPSPNSSNYGSAGSGGGGGGYNITSGSGNGGDGQDGYVMIEWRK